MVWWKLLDLCPKVEFFPEFNLCPTKIRINHGLVKLHVLLTLRARGIDYRIYLRNGFFVFRAKHTTPARIPYISALKKIYLLFFFLRMVELRNWSLREGLKFKSEKGSEFAMEQNFADLKTTFCEISQFFLSFVCRKIVRFLCILRKSIIANK